MPLLYLGSLIGVRVGMMMSPLQVAFSLTITLLYVAYKSLTKGLDFYKKENKALIAKPL